MHVAAFCQNENTWYYGTDEQYKASEKELSVIQIKGSEKECLEYCQYMQAWSKDPSMGDLDEYDVEVKSL